MIRLQAFVPRGPLGVRPAGIQFSSPSRSTFIGLRTRPRTLPPSKTTTFPSQSPFMTLRPPWLHFTSHCESSPPVCFLGAVTILDPAFSPVIPSSQPASPAAACPPRFELRASASPPTPDFPTSSPGSPGAVRQARRSMRGTSACRSFPPSRLAMHAPHSIVNLKQIEDASPAPSPWRPDTEAHARVLCCRRRRAALGRISGSWEALSGLRVSSGDSERMASVVLASKRPSLSLSHTTRRVRH